MNKAELPIHPKEAVGAILKKLPNKRLRDVIERRFGIKGSAMTLDAIGKNYDITRERVRQIENDALKHLKKPEVSSYLAPVFGKIREYIEYHGGVVAYRDFLLTVADKAGCPHVELLLALHPDVRNAPESDDYKQRLYSKKEALADSERVVHDVIQKLHAHKTPISGQALQALVADSYSFVVGSRPSPDTVDAHVRVSKRIAQNPYQEYGLIHWPTIQPKSIRDKAYVVLFKHGKPLHFQQVAIAIDQSGFRGKRKAHPQTVHNELIKDGQRFVLVGRGLYALKEWGYTPGTVQDVIEDILKKEDKGMHKDAIIQAVLERRFVKENTIMLNLQNKNYFKRGENGTYYLA